MDEVCLRRTDASVDWGFQVQGGFEQHKPWTMTHIVPDSPAHGHIQSGDMLIEIAGHDVTHMIQQEILELLEHGTNELQLTIQRADCVNPSEESQALPAEQQSLSMHDPSSRASLATSETDNAPMPMSLVDLIADAMASEENRHSIITNYLTSEPTANVKHPSAGLVNTAGSVPSFANTPTEFDLTKATPARRHCEYPSISEESDNVPGAELGMNRRMIVPPEAMNQHHYTAANPIRPFTYAGHAPAPPKRLIQPDTDEISQSRSFQMLQGWMGDSEQGAPASVLHSTPSPPTMNRSAVARAIVDEQNHPYQLFNRADIDSCSSLSSLPSRSFRYLQDQYKTEEMNSATHVEESLTPRESSGLRRSSDAHTPSRSFKYLQDQYDQIETQPTQRSLTTNNRTDLTEVYSKQPASFRQHEPEARRYSGSTVPSRSFRFLQMMTDKDQVNDSTPVPGYMKPQLLPMQQQQHYQPIRPSHGNQFNDHPSRSFKYLQEITGEHPPTSLSAARRMGSIDEGSSLNAPESHSSATAARAAHHSSAPANQSNNFSTDVRPNAI